MLPSDRSSYSLIISNLTELGFNVLNLDWRGHGESIHKEEKCLQGGFPTTAACPLYYNGPETPPSFLTRQK